MMHRRNLWRFGLAVQLLLLATAGAETVDLPVRQSEKMVHAADGWQPIAPIYRRGKDGYCVEAEKASSLLTAPGRSGVQEAAATGGAFLRNPRGLTFELRAPRKEVVALRLRLRRNKDYTKPSAVNKFVRSRTTSPMMPTLSLSGKRIICDRFAWRKSAWDWLQVTAFELEPGTHRLKIGALSGYDLDRIALVPAKPKDFRGDTLSGTGATAGANALGADDEEDDEGDLDDLELEDRAPPPDLAKMPLSPAALAPEASLTTVEISPLSVQAWTRLALRGKLTGRVEIAASTDHGKTWQAVGADGDLAGVTGRESLQVRVVLRPAPTGAVPVIEGVDVGFTPGAAAGVTIAGPGLTLVFDGASAALYGVYATADRRRLGLPLRRELFRLHWRPAGGGKTQVIAASQCDLQGGVRQAADGTHWEVPFSHAAAGLSGLCRIQPPVGAGQEWQWQVTVKNAGTGTVRGVASPLLDSLRLGGFRLMPQSLWSVRDRGIFPGNMSMGFVFAANEREGIYLAAHDQSLVGVQLGAVGRSGLTTLDAMSFGVVVPGSTRTYDYALAYGSPDWHWAADLYRDWAMSWMKRPDYPAWAKLSSGWWTLMSDTEAALFDRRSTTVFEVARWFGLPHLQFWMGCGDGEFCGRLPYLSPRLGTPAMSKQDGERIRRLGGHLGYYIQSREWDAAFYDSDYLGFIPRRYFPDEREVEDYDWSNRNVCNGPWKGKRAGRRVMSPMSAEWRAHIARHAAERVSLFGNDVAYFDQMGCTTMTDNNPAHGPEYHASGLGYTKMAEEALAAMRRHQPQAVIAQEGMNAATGQFVQFHLPACLPYPDFGRYFLYTFPDAALFTGSGNNVFAQTDGDLGKFMRSRFLMHRFEAPKHDAYVRQLVLLRQRVHDWQFRGRFMDNLGLAVSIGGEPQTESGRWSSTANLIAKWCLYDTDAAKGILITFQNEPLFKDARLSLDRARVPFALGDRAFAYFDDGAVETLFCEVTKQVLTLAAPARQVGAILIPGPVAAAQALRTFAYQSLTDAGKLVIAAVNISDQPLAATWQTASGRGKIDLAPFGVFRRELRIDNILQADSMVDVTVAWEAGGARSSATALLTPSMRNRGFELDADANGSPDSWWNFSNGFGHVIHRYAHDVDMRALPAKIDATVKRTGAASVRLRGPTPYELSIDGAFGMKGGKRTFPSSISQHLFHLSPATEYEVTVHAYAEQPRAKVTLSAGGQRTSRTLPKGKWTPLTVRFKTPARVRQAVVSLGNNSAPGTSVWFDNVTLSR